MSIQVTCIPQLIGLILSSNCWTIADAAGVVTQSLGYMLLISPLQLHGGVPKHACQPPGGATPRMSQQSPWLANSSSSSRVRSKGECVKPTLRATETALQPHPIHLPSSAPFPLHKMPESALSLTDGHARSNCFCTLKVL